jgi:hypothetical protein
VSESVLFALLPDPSFQLPFSVRQIGRWVDKNRAEVRIVVGLAMEQEKAGLARDRQPDLIRKFETAATFGVDNSNLIPEAAGRTASRAPSAIRPKV